MSLLNVPYRPFPRVLSLALCTVIKTFSVYQTHCKTSAQQPKAPARWSESGRMADSAPNTHRLWAQARQLLQLRGSGAHADQYPWQPPQFPVPRRRHHDSPPVQKFYRIQEHPAASKQQLAQFHHCWDPPVLKTGCMSCVGSFWPPGNWGQSWTEICCSNVLEFTVEWEKRSWHKRCAFVERQRKFSKDLWTESWLGRPRRERKLSKNCMKLRLRLRREIGKREILKLLCREDQSRIWISTIPPTSSKSMGRSGSKRQHLLVWRVGIEKQALPRRDHARNCQEIEELRRICCEDTDQARQERIEEQRNP